MAKETKDFALGPGNLYVNNQNIGYLDGEVSASSTIDKVDYYDGFPRKKVRSDIRQADFSIKASIMQLTLANIAMALGAATISSQPGTQETRTVENEECRVEEHHEDEDTTYFIRTQHGNISSVTVKSDDGETTYTADTDYEIADAEQGGIVILAQALQSTEVTLKVSYSYTETVGGSEKLEYGNTATIDTLQNVAFVAPNVGGKFIHIKMPKAQCTSGGELKFNTEANEYMSVDVTFEAEQDEQNPSAALVEIEIIDSNPYEHN